MPRTGRGGFRALWAATAVSNLGDGIRLTALPLLATSVTTDPRLIAGVTFADRLPWLVLILPGGVLADRVDRRVLRVTLDLARAAVMGVFAVLVAVGASSIWLIFAAAALLASAEAVVDSSSMAIVPSLVEESGLERAAGIMSGTELVANSLVGPPLGGLLFVSALAVPFAVDASSFLLAAVLATTLAGTFRARPSTDPAAPTVRRRATESIREGFQWLWAQTTLRSLALISTFLGTVAMAETAIFVLFAQQKLGVDEVGYGLLLVPPAIGGIAGSLVAPRLRRFRLARVLGVAIALSGATTTAIALSSDAVVVATLLAADTMGIIMWNVLTVALRQRLVPDHILGRVGASYRLLVYCGMPIGALAGGIIADRFGVRWAVATTGLGLLAIVPVILLTVRVDATPAPAGAPDAQDTQNSLPSGSARVTHE